MIKMIQKGLESLMVSQREFDRNNIEVVSSLMVQIEDSMKMNFDNKINEL
jgi:hypothetical protein